MDNTKVTCLVLLDLSVAFDMVSHDLLLNKLEYRCGFTGTILKWICNYLTCREQCVVTGSSKDRAMSKPATLTKGVPKEVYWDQPYLPCTLYCLEAYAKNMKYSSMGMQMTSKIILLSPLTPQVISADV